jgi:hypothetical protein
MFNTENKLFAFKNLRDDIDQSDDPLLVAVKYWLNLPHVKYTMDPWDKETWPSPWELIQEKEICNFGQILGLCYTLQLTETFSHEQFEIIIGIDEQRSEYQYLVSVKNLILGFNGEDTIITKKDLPSGFMVEKIHTMPRLQ